MEIKADLLAALAAVSDDSFAGVGFTRRKGSLDYVRTFRDAQQTISFAVDWCPKYLNGEELHLHPSMHLAIKAVTEAALRLVAGNKILLANAPDMIVNQPIEFAAPKYEHVRWIASGVDQIKEKLVEICVFVKKWVIPFLDQLTTPDDLIDVYDRNDGRLMKQRHWYLFVAAAYLEKGRTSEALEVLERNLGVPGLRKRYSVAFDALDSKKRC